MSSVESFSLYPERPLEDVTSSDVKNPTITVYLPRAENAHGGAVVVCPGGGYNHLALEHEGEMPAKWLLQMGYSVFVLRYRHGQNRHPLPLQDLLRAVRWVRAHADSYRISRDKVGVMGFSAGGHLCASASTLFDLGDKEAEDHVDSFSSRPDFAVLVYPVIQLTGEYAHAGSGNNLFGENTDEETLKKFSPQLNVTAQTPPTFLVHMGEDTVVPPENSVLYYLALRKAGVPAELHVYERGGHGGGFRAIHHWMGAAARWLSTQLSLPRTNF